jgi:hypothetical protein
MSSSDYDALMRVNRCAEECHGRAHRVIRQHGTEFHEDWSRDPWLASKQARESLEQIENEVAELREAIDTFWDAAADTSEFYFIRCSIGVSRPPIYVEDVSFVSAHEAACGLAELAVKTILKVRSGEDDFDSLRRVAASLAELGPVDIWAHIEQEFHAASKLIGLDQEPRIAADTSPRLTIAGENVVSLDGPLIAVKPNGYMLFQLLLNSPGDYVPLLQHGLRTRDVQSLPETLRNVIESDPGAGTRIKREWVV